MLKSVAKAAGFLAYLFITLEMFTDPVPKQRKKSFAEAGIETFHYR